MNDSDVVDLHVGVKGRFKLSVLKNGVVQRESGWFDNLITDLGMDQLASASTPFRYGQVGSSSASPAYSDTALGSRIAGVDSGSNGYTSMSIDAINRYAVFRFVYTFLAGAAAGNIAEVGVSNNLAGTQLTSHARVLDSGGSPTTITVLAGEDLVLVYEFQAKQPTGDFTALVSGKNVTIRAALVNATSGSGAWGDGGMVLAARGGTSDNGAYTGAIGAISARPSGTSAVTGMTVVNAAYVAGSWTRTGTITWGTSVANFAVKSFAWIFGFTSWQMEMDTTLTKNNTQTLRLGVRLTWSRDSGPTP